MAKILSKIRDISPQMSHKEGRDHMRFCATGKKHDFVNVTRRELVDFMCEIDAYEYYHEKLLSTLEMIAEVVTENEPIDPERINKILENALLYQRLPNKAAAAKDHRPVFEQSPQATS